ncbi:hypothetical protein PVAP13_6NG076430 [Panicum virgatum]|uniref:Uncharacterized protein n=1 Tax=Panicum virgatum TaxID=38727 RepID=A0A8T0QVU8_PANVG|nr:hypothetical protein PVAP13_6NG076430 [Panicum virgatum]
MLTLALSSADVSKGLTSARVFSWPGGRGGSGGIVRWSARGGTGRGGSGRQWRSSSGRGGSRAARRRSRSGAGDGRRVVGVLGAGAARSAGRRRGPASGWHRSPAHAAGRSKGGRGRREAAAASRPQWGSTTPELDDAARCGGGRGPAGQRHFIGRGTATVLDGGGGVARDSW